MSLKVQKVLNKKSSQKILKNYEWVVSVLKIKRSLQGASEWYEFEKNHIAKLTCISVSCAYN